MPGAGLYKSNQAFLAKQTPAGSRTHHANLALVLRKTPPEHDELQTLPSMMPQWPASPITHHPVTWLHLGQHAAPGFYAAPAVRRAGCHGPGIARAKRQCPDGMSG